MSIASAIDRINAHSSWLHRTVHTAARRKSSVSLSLPPANLSENSVPGEPEPVATIDDYLGVLSAALDTHNGPLGIVAIETIDMLLSSDIISDLHSLPLSARSEIPRFDSEILENDEISTLASTISLLVSALPHFDDQKFLVKASGFLLTRGMCDAKGGESLLLVLRGLTIVYSFTSPDLAITREVRSAATSALSQLVDAILASFMSSSPGFHGHPLHITIQHLLSGLSDPDHRMAVFSSGLFRTLLRNGTTLHQVPEYIACIRAQLIPLVKTNVISQNVELQNASTGLLESVFLYTDFADDLIINTFVDAMGILGDIEKLYYSQGIVLSTFFDFLHLHPASALRVFHSVSKETSVAAFSNILGCVQRYSATLAGHGKSSESAMAIQMYVMRFTSELLETWRRWIINSDIQLVLSAFTETWTVILASFSLTLNNPEFSIETSSLAIDGIGSAFALAASLNLSVEKEAFVTALVSLSRVSEHGFHKLLDICKEHGKLLEEHWGIILAQIFDYEFSNKTPEVSDEIDSIFETIFDTPTLLTLSVQLSGVLLAALDKGNEFKILLVLCRLNMLCVSVIHHESWQSFWNVLGNAYRQCGISDVSTLVNETVINYLFGLSSLLLKSSESYSKLAHHESQLSPCDSLYVESPDSEGTHMESSSEVLPVCSNEIIAIDNQTPESVKLAISSLHREIIASATKTADPIRDSIITEKVCCFTKVLLSIFQCETSSLYRAFFLENLSSILDHSSLLSNGSWQHVFGVIKLSSESSDIELNRIALECLVEILALCDIPHPVLILDSLLVLLTKPAMQDYAVRLVSQVITSITQTSGTAQVVEVPDSLYSNGTYTGTKDQLYSYIWSKSLVAFAGLVLRKETSHSSKALILNEIAELVGAFSTSFSESLWELLLNVLLPLTQDCYFRDTVCDTSRKLGQTMLPEHSQDSCVAELTMLYTFLEAIVCPHISKLSPRLFAEFLDMYFRPSNFTDELRGKIASNALRQFILTHGDGLEPCQWSQLFTRFEACMKSLHPTEITRDNVEVSRHERRNSVVVFKTPVDPSIVFAKASALHNLCSTVEAISERYFSVIPDSSKQLLLLALFGLTEISVEFNNDTLLRSVLLKTNRLNTTNMVDLFTLETYSVFILCRILIENYKSFSGSVVWIDRLAVYFFQRIVEDEVHEVFTIDTELVQRRQSVCRILRSLSEVPVEDFSAHIPSLYPWFVSMVVSGGEDVRYHLSLIFQNQIRDLLNVQK